MTLALAAWLALAAASPSVETANAETTGLRARSAEGQVDVRLRGRLYYDFAFIREDQTQQDGGTEFRRFRPAVTAKILNVWRFRSDLEIRPRSRPTVRNLHLSYRGIRRTELRAGNQASRVSLEGRTSSAHFSFMRRSVANALVPGALTGLSARHWGRIARTESNDLTYRTSIGVFFEPFGQADRDRHDAGGLSVVARAGMALRQRPKGTFHLGISGHFRSIDDGGYRLRARSGSAFAERLLNTGRLEDVSYTLTNGAEAAWAWGPLMLQAEFLRTTVWRRENDNPSFWGGYVFGAVLLTGEQRRYRRKRGAFGWVEPHGDWGALEAAFRWGRLDLEDAGIRGGTETDFTLGLNWYKSRDLRVLLNYALVDTRRREDGLCERPWLIQGRVQLGI